MAIKLMYITNNEKVAQIAEKSGVDWIFIDLEIRGKAARQGGLNTVKSNHSIKDVKKIKKVLKHSELLVRVNSPYEGLQDEIEQVINDGADIVMLPFFKTKEEVEAFIRYVKARAKTCLLLETPEAVENIDTILEVTGIDFIHIGLNDLHLAYKMHFMFELLADGTVEKLCKIISKNKIPYGFGGMARIGELDPPAENILTEHYRLGSSMVILARSFCDAGKIESLDQIKEIFEAGVQKIRDFEKILLQADKNYFDDNQKFVHDRIVNIANNIEERLVAEGKN